MTLNKHCSDYSSQASLRCSVQSLVSEETEEVRTARDESELVEIPVKIVTGMQAIIYFNIIIKVGFK